MATCGKKTGLEELLAGIPDNKLDRRISNTHLDKIARSMKSWREVTPYLDLTEAEEEDILNDHRRHRRQKSAALRKWREKLGRCATYRNLARALHEAGLIDTIDVIRCAISTPEIPASLEAPHLQGFKWMWILVAFGALAIPLLMYQYGVGCPPLPLTLKAPIEHFVGRDAEMKEAIESLQSFRIVNIVGPPGFGKSALAISVGHQLKDNGHDIIFIDMSNVIDPHNLKQWILHIVNITTTTNDTMVDLKLQMWASKLKCPVVIILDGCDAMFYENKNELYRSITSLVEPSYNIRVLTTSRQSLVQLNSRGISLRELSLQSAVTLMGKLHPQLNDTQKYLLANVTGNAPLALVVIGALLHRAYAPTPDEVISDLQDRQTFLGTLSQPDMDAKLRVDSCIEYSYKFLDIQSQTLSQYLANFPASFTADAACCIATDNCELTAIQTREGNETRGLLSNLTQNDCRKKLNDLVTRSLLELDRPTQKYRLHKVIQEFLRTRQNEELVAIFEGRFLVYYSKLGLAYPSIHTLLSEKTNMLHIFDILHSCCSVDDRFLYARKTHQMFFLVVENVDVSLLHTSLLQCSVKNYDVCATSLEYIFQRNFASRPVVKAAVLSYFLSLYGNFTDNELVLEVMIQEGIELYPLVMEIPNSELLDTQYFDAILVPLYHFYLKIGKQEWAYNVIEKNLEIWKASDLTMSELMRNLMSHLMVKHCNTGNYSEANKVIDANIVNTRRTLRKMKEKRFLIPDDAADTAMKDSTDLISILEYMKRLLKVRSKVLHHVDTLGEVHVICVFDPYIASSLCEQLDAAINEWEDLPHQQLRAIIDQEHYKSMEGVMKHYINLRARVHFCVDISGVIIPMDCRSIDRSLKGHSLPAKRWIGIDQEVALVQRNEHVYYSHFIKKTGILIVQFNVEMQLLRGLTELYTDVKLHYGTYQEIVTVTYWEEMKSIREDSMEVAHDVLLPIEEYRSQGKKLQTEVDIIVLTSRMAEEKRIRCIWERKSFEIVSKIFDDLLLELEIHEGPFAKEFLESLKVLRTELSFCAESDGVMVINNDIDPHKELELAYYEVTRTTELFTLQIFMWLLDIGKHDLETLPAALVNHGFATEVHFRLGWNEMKILCLRNHTASKYIHQVYNHIAAVLEYVHAMYMTLKYSLAVDPHIWSTVSVERKSLFAKMILKSSNMYFCTKFHGFLISVSNDIDSPNVVPLSEELHIHVDTYKNLIAAGKYVLESTTSVGIKHTHTQEVVQYIKCIWSGETATPVDVDLVLTSLIEILKLNVLLSNIAKSPGFEELMNVFDRIEDFWEAEVNIEKFSKLQTKLHFCVDVSLKEILPFNTSIVPEVGMSDRVINVLGQYIQISFTLNLVLYSQLTKITGFNNGQEEVRYICVWDKLIYKHAQELLEDGTIVLDYLYHSVRRDSPNMKGIEEQREYFHTVRSKLYLCLYLGLKENTHQSCCR